MLRRQVNAPQPSDTSSIPRPRSRSRPPRPRRGFDANSCPPPCFPRACVDNEFSNRGRHMVATVRNGPSRKESAAADRPWYGGKTATRSISRSKRASDDHPQRSGTDPPCVWGGDLNMGRANHSAVITLVDRASRYPRLVHVADSHSAEPTTAEETTGHARHSDGEPPHEDLAPAAEQLVRDDDQTGSFVADETSWKFDLCGHRHGWTCAETATRAKGHQARRGVRGRTGYRGRMASSLGRVRFVRRVQRRLEELALTAGQTSSQGGVGWSGRRVSFQNLLWPPLRTSTASSRCPGCSSACDVYATDSCRRPRRYAETPF
ncbi:hypothetical protein SAMN05421630_11361 [Prauserella marina]|uniref:Uncharacterized protein n=1 Tax=Prauserella marina TaxID=530584 RepID=A0A1G6Y0S3_9PSEU|nr:hypothetical protein DES30_103156 [Prauserella marina]SDD83871.1 hypothetical protein SAMN05421630_11361 [Prauserella marina]